MNCLRYSRADYLRKLVRQQKTQSNMQIIHRSVGEPAEGSLTRYPTYQPTRIVFTPPEGKEWVESEQRIERDCFAASACSSYLSWKSKGFCFDTVFLLTATHCLLVVLSFHWELLQVFLFTYFTPFFASWLYYCCSFFSFLLFDACVGMKKWKKDHTFN